MWEQRFQGIDNWEKEEDSLKGIRQRARAHCGVVDPLNRKSEAYRYLPLSRWEATSWTCALPPKLSEFSVPPSLGASLVFVDGYFCPDLSDFSAWPSSVEVLPLSKAMKSHRSLLQHRFQTGLLEETDFLAALNLCVHGEGAFIYVPPRLCLAEPLRCFYLTSKGDQKAPVISSPRLHLFLGAQAMLKMDIVDIEKRQSTCLNAVIDIAMEEESQCKVHREFAGAETQWYFSALRATLKKGAVLESTSRSLGSACVRQADQVALVGEGAEVQLRGLTMLEGNKHSHAHIRVDHRAPHTQSTQQFKTLLDGASQSSFEGKILVRKEAQKTQAYQLNNNLLLDDRAVANSKPNLEIFADDVKASHGVTVTQLRQDELFYLRSRGLSEAAAKRLLVEGFCQLTPVA
ncbi:MAG: SufD family Fe-S cluster assembly protein [Bacteroidetes bacterium]|nr:SufD family Fe-S cluster assembly protein [Bacteroidota bacterium]